ncbi:hypothetical protein [Modestobacter versicolor]|uniref:Uncharacterized protein n=1 Tax=Modestobacter versicolor TaxID=429133 RepID=A0A323V454_9ACTN|nr:hypothetical protein [Modestobacter versicolor]MBB3676702.1 hypothetical protein [Modestobacter versicolor]PZA19575.1 hypothetical protein DMO24_20030 [Modestobacter versicolor]
MPALDDPQTRTAVDALRAGALRWLAGGVLAVVLGLLMGAAVVRIVENGGSRPPFAGLMVVALVAGGVAVTVVGLGSLVRVRRWTAALARTEWRSGLLRIAGPAVLQVEPLGFDEFTDEPLRLQLMSTAVWRTRAVQQLNGADVRYAEVSEQEWLLTADGAGTLYGARAARRR